MLLALGALLVIFGGLAVLFHHDRRRERRPTREGISHRVRRELEAEVRAEQERGAKFRQALHDADRSE